MSGRSNKGKRKNNTYNSTKQNSGNSGPIRKGPSRKTRKNANNKRMKKDHSTLKKVIIIAVILIFLLILIAGGVFVGIFFSDKFAMTKEDLLIGYSNTIIYDAKGNVISELSGKENRKIISIGDMSEYLPKAFVAIEDERFYKHHGVDIKRTTAATFTYITNSGSSNFGGSTITQQLIKNITNEKESSGKAGMQRKIREMSRAYQIEKMLEKEQILELYLNLIPLASSGGDVCGVETASLYYFNKSASDLSIEECAFLAGVTHSPSNYNPYRENQNTSRINSRTKTVLAKMKGLGYINDQQYNTAIAKVDEGLKFEKGELSTSTIKSYFISAAVDQVVNQLVEEKGMSVEYAKSRVYGGGLKIYTTLEPEIQQTVETEYKSDKYVKPSKKHEGQHTQSAMVIIDHKFGKVVGCMGGLGTDVDAIGINRINSTRQPGSSIKPIGVYGPALEKGIINASTIYDNTYPTYFGKEYAPKNATSAKSGLCTIRDAIEVSSNIVACKVMTEMTPDVAIDYLRELGVTSLVKANETAKPNDVNDSNTSLALGTCGISPLEMATAYATIANNGVYIEPTFYTEVKDSSDNLIIKANQQQRRVMSEGNAYVMQMLLKQPVEGSNGTAKICKMANIDVGAKTGTTQDQFDVWLCGFTPYYTAATWFGYDQNEYINTAGGSQATLIWNDVMKTIHATKEAKTFEKPSNVVTAVVCRSSGKCATSSCTSTYTEYFVEGAVPGKCEGHNSFKVCTESKKLATEYCQNTEIIKGLAMPEKEVKAKWKTNGGSKYTVVTDKCNIHTEATQKNKPNNENNNGNNNNEPKKDNDITVTNVVGKTESQAKGALGELSVNVEYKSDSTKANGIVISQSIKAGAIVSKDAKITLVVNKIDASSNKPSTNPNNNTTNTNSNNNQNANPSANSSVNQ